MSEAGTRLALVEAPWPGGDGEMGGRIRARDWAETRLGPIETWPERLKAVVDLMLSAPQPACIGWGPDGTTLYNDSAVVLLGARHPDALGKPFRDAWPDVWNEFQPLVAATMADEAQILADRPVPLAGQTGSRMRWFTFAWTPLRDGAGDVAGFFCTATETTDAVLARERQRESERSLRVLIDGIPQLVWRSTAGGCWTWAGPQWTAYTGLSDAASHNRGWLDAVHPHDRTAAEEGWRRAGEAGRFEADYRIRCAADGAWRWFQSRGAPVQGGGGGTVEWLGTSTDIDDQMQARAALKRAGERLEAVVSERTAELMAAEQSLRQVQKMDAVGQLTGGLAHDFNNMLQGIASGVQMARRRVAAGRMEDAERYLDVASGGVSRAAGLTRRLLAFARRQRLAPKPVDVDGLVAGLVDLLRRTVGPGVGLDLNLHNGGGAVVCDPNELENALLNLCINARDAMPDGGRLTIGTLDTQLAEAELARDETCTPGRYIVISVTDTGKGMTPEVLDRVFEPFFTTKPVGEGTGLGLSMVYGFVRQSGGIVRISSAPAQGTTVRLFMPMHDHAEAGAEVPLEVRTPAQSDRGAAVTVLLVDDEASVRGPVADRLRELGFVVLEAGDGPAALRFLDFIRPDLLMTDVGLPGGMNGRQVAEAARERIPTLPVLFVTGYAATELPAGFEVIDKPFELDHLALRVQALLAAARQGRTQGDA